MKKFSSTIIVIGVIVLIAFWLIGKYNGLVVINEETENAWSKVESAYQRRSDLIPNIVKTAQGYAKFENKTLTEVVEARAKATSVNIDASNVTPDQIAAFQSAQGGLSSAFSKLLVSVERYPDLKANENFKELINELERTENQINVERNRFNDVVKDYNNKVKTLPTALFAKYMGFLEKGYFNAEKGTEKAPEVDFNFDS